MTTQTWPNRQVHEQFFDELRALLERYPNITDRMIMDYEDNPSNPHWSHDGGYDHFSPKSPTFLQGVIVLVSYSNMEHYEDLNVLEPYEQSSFMSVGMLSRASSGYGLPDLD